MSNLRMQESDLREQKRSLLDFSNGMKDCIREAEKACREPRKRIAMVQMEINQLEEEKKTKQLNLETMKNDDGEQIRVTPSMRRTGLVAAGSSRGVCSFC